MTSKSVRRHNLPMLKVMNDDASMNENAGEKYAGLDRFECRKQVIKDLEELGLMVEIEDISHAVGYSERGDVPIETIISAQWFCNMKELAKPAIKAVEEGKIKFLSGTLDQDLFPLDGKHSRLVYQSSDLVGSPHSGLVQ